MNKDPVEFQKKMCGDVEIKEKKDISCDTCGLIFETADSDYKNHIKKHEEDALKCQFCAKIFKSNNAMLRHQISIHNEGSFHKCQQCKFTTPHPSTLEAHVNRRHDINSPYSCEHCDLKYKRHTEFMRHSRTHETFPYECYECDALFPTSRALSTHLNRNHRKRKTFNCTLCKRKLRSAKNLKIHLQVHDQHFFCDECGIHFPRKQAIRQHVKIHLGEKAFLCETCGKVFATLRSKQVHTLKHVNKRPYVCEICEQSFTQRTPMMVHRKNQHPGNHPPPPPIRVASLLQKFEKKLLNKRKNGEKK